MLCERCLINEAIKKERYCKDCRKEVLRELKESGYLTPKPFRPYRPPAGSTNFDPSPSGENAVRILEDG